MIPIVGNGRRSFFGEVFGEVSENNVNLTVVESSRARRKPILKLGVGDLFKLDILLLSGIGSY
jgi:hypothetical protein